MDFASVIASVAYLVNSIKYTSVECYMFVFDVEQIVMDSLIADNKMAENGSNGTAAAATPVPSEGLSALKIDAGAEGTGSSGPASPGSPAGNGSFPGSFKAFSKFGDPKSDGKQITLSQSDKWMKQAKVIDGKKITTTDTGIYFKKHK